jgi:hypothetical protein
VILAVFVAATVACTHAAFPGPRATCPSPNGVRVIRWAEPEAGGDQHRLWIGAARGDGETLLLAFPRHVEVFWSPTGRQLAVTNSWTSDESTVLLWSRLEQHPADLLARLMAQEGQEEARWNAHHLYLEAKGWRDDETLRIRLWGYGDAPHSLDRGYVYSVRKGFSRE